MSTTETKATLKQLAKRVSIKSEFGARKPWHEQDNWRRQATGWTCTLRYEGRRYTFDFWQGAAISGEPDAVGVLECLLSDAQGGDQTFGDFCNEYGYDTNSRKAEATWRACQKAMVSMKRLLGADYETFLYAERD